MSAINDLNLFIDVTNRRLVRDIFSDQEAVLPRLTQGDGYNLRVHAVTPRPGRPIGQPYQFVPLPDGFFVGVGKIGDVDLTGTFTVTYDGDTTAAISANATAVQVAAAINALASVTSAGGVTVAGADGGPWQVSFVTAGVRDFFSANTDQVFPFSSFRTYRLRTGTVSLSEIQLFVVDPQLATLAETFTNLPAAAGEVNKLQIGAAGVPDIQRVTISGDAYDGGFTLTFDGETTGIIPQDADPTELQSALEALPAIGAGNIAVTGTKPNWDVSFTGLAGSQTLMTIDVDGLVVPIGKQGLLTLATGGIELLVANQSTAQAKFEVSGIVSGSHATILQLDCTIQNDGIQNDPVAAPTTPTLATQSEVTAVAARVTTAESDIVALEGRMDTAETDITTLEGRMDTAETDITTLEGQVYVNPLTTAGDVILAGASGVQQRLAIGAAGQVLRSNGTTAAWSTNLLTSFGTATKLNDGEAASSGNAIITTITIPPGSWVIESEAQMTKQVGSESTARGFNVQIICSGTTTFNGSGVGLRQVTAGNALIWTARSTGTVNNVSVTASGDFQSGSIRFIASIINVAEQVINLQIVPIIVSPTANGSTLTTAGTIKATRTA